MTDQVATLAGGCFWCLEAVFLGLKGVRQVLPGYSGGDRPTPSYEQVCTGTTGHAEAVQITFDPTEISYADLLRVFFTVHDPTTLNRQGADVGTQYRSAIFVHDDTQRATAEQVIGEIASLWDAPIVTTVTPVTRFWEAEPYHHDYFATHPHQGYCAAVIAPKVAKFRARFASRLKPQGPA